jgi:hypothetical protein
MSDYPQTDEGGLFNGQPSIAWLGVNNRLPPEKLPAGLVADGLNVRMRNGDIEPRLGLIKPGWANSVDGVAVRPSASVLHGAGVFSDPSTREWILTAADGQVWACAPNNYRQAVTLPTGVQIRSAASFCQAFNQMFLFRGRYLAPLVIRSWANGFEDVVAQYNSASTYKAAILAIEQAADEVAYGPYQAVTSVTRSNNVATVTTTTPHGYITGADVTIKGANESAYNGRVNITVLDEVTFTYHCVGSPTTPATGTIKCSNNSLYWKALGDRLTLGAGALTSAGTTATVNYTAHGLSVGQWVTISGADQAGYNGLYQIQSVADADHFTYTLAAAIGTSPATGTIYVYKPTVTAGHTPDSNPEAWARIYNVLPNADFGVFINGRLLVPTAFTPGDSGYDATSSWSKVDYIIALDVFDPVHFTFTNGFRINQGDDSEITNIVKYDANTAIVTKGKRWGVLANLQGDYSQITFDLRQGEYGCPSVRSAAVGGKDIYFPSPQRGLVSLAQSGNGILQGVDRPFSADVPAWVRRINWNAVSQQRVSWWDNYLYWAVALDSSAVNNAVLVYDFELKQWVSLDTGISVKEFFIATLGGRERLFCLDNAGWVNLMEEATAGDQAQADAAPGGLSWAAITTDVTLAGEMFGAVGPKVFPLVELGLATWNPRFTVTVQTGGNRTTKVAVQDKTFSRTAYYKPFARAAWDPLNAAGDFAEPNRYDYSVQLLDGMNLTGCNTLLYQEFCLRPSTRTFRANYAMIRIRNTQGRLKVKQVQLAAQPGERRMGLMI